MIEVLKERSLRYVALLDIDGTSVPTLDSMAVWLQKEGRQWTREQVLSAPLGHNSNPELHREQIQLIHDPIFLRSLSPHPGTINALGMLQEHGFPYITWSARAVEPKEARDATVDWIKDTLTPAPIGVWLNPEPRINGALFKMYGYLAILDGCLNDPKNMIVPVVAFEDDNQVADYLVGLGLNVFLIGEPEGKSVSHTSPYLFGPYGSLNTAVLEFLYRWDMCELTVRVPGNDVLMRRSILRHRWTDIAEKGLIGSFPYILW